MFDNLIIPIDSTEHLKIICRVLKEMGYRKTRNGFCTHDNYVVTSKEGKYRGVISDTNYKLGYKRTSFSKLLQLNWDKNL